MKIGFIGLGNVGGKLAGTLLRNGHALMVRDLNQQLRAARSCERGASAADIAARDGSGGRSDHHLPALAGGVGARWWKARTAFWPHCAPGRSGSR